MAHTPGTQGKRIWVGVSHRHLLIMTLKRMEELIPQVVDETTMEKDNKSQVDVDAGA